MQATSCWSVSTSSGKSFASMTSSKPTATTGDDSDTDAIGGISDNEGDYMEQRGLAEKEKAVQYYGGRNTPGKAKASNHKLIIYTDQVHSEDHTHYLQVCSRIYPTPQ